MGRTIVIHDMSGTPEYLVWKAMRARCKSSNPKMAPYYRDRGISVCKRWDSFVNFYADMGAKPSSKHSIDRINNDKGYSPSNCRWATKEEQQTNKRGTYQLTMNGETLNIAQWARRYGLIKTTLWTRIIKRGESLQEAVKY
jgi:hypothetical protein